MENPMLQVEEGLEYRFLYGNDPDSMHLLLSMIEHNRKLSNIQPRYQLMKQITTSLKRSLRARRDANYVLSALKKLIHDDVNRFEFAIFLKGYDSGLRDSFFVDRLERIALRTFGPDELAGMAELFHHAKEGRVMGLQSMAFHHLKTETEGFPQCRHLSNLYSRRVLRKKIFQLNGSLDAQIIMDLDHLSRLKVEEERLDLKELSELYQKINRYLYNNVTKVYKYAYWTGLNDAVLERYAR